MSAVEEALAALPLVDHHCHGVVQRDLERAEFEAMLTEASAVSPLGTTLFDSLIGFAVRRHCAPVLDLPPLAPADAYLARRSELGYAEVTRRFLTELGTSDFCVDAGFVPEPVTSPAELARLAGGTGHEVARLEQVAEDVVRAGTSAEGFAGAVREALAARTSRAVGVKSIAAYRVGLDLDGGRPSDAEVSAAAGEWLRAVEAGGAVRCADPVLARFLVWCGIDRGLPVQFHVGLGDSDVDLHRCDPLLLTALLRATQSADVPVMLLHNYPFHRRAAYLAQVFPHVFVDLGLTTHNVGHRASAVLAELLELAPFGKVLFSSDAWGLPELFHLGTVLFRRSLAEVLDAGVDDGAWTPADAVRVAGLVGSGNARRAYRLAPG